MDDPDVLTADEKQRYDAAWTRYCIYTTCSWLLSGSYLACVALVTLLQPALAKTNQFEAVATLWVLASIVSGWICGSFRCPRCNLWYFRCELLGIPYYRWFTSNCVHCGLRKYTYGTEPE